MKKLLVLSLTVVLTAVSSVFSDQVTLVGGSGYGPYQTGSGGEFTLQTDVGLSWVLSFYNSNLVTQTRDVFTNDTFQTFCVEVGEHISANGTYDATISQTSIFSGVPLTLGAAWLYGQFASGTLTNYDYTRANTATVQDLQSAIWYFMGQAPYNSLNQYTQLADTNFVTDANALAPSAGAYNVAVLNLWTPGQAHTPENAHQDQLVLVQDPTVVVPEPTSLALLGFGLGILVLLSRKRR